MKCNSDNIQYDTVKEAMQNVGIILTTNDDASLLIWRDSLSQLINYSKLRPWQIINRIPFSNIFCRKTSLSTILREGQQIFPAFFNFYPDSFLLPDEFEIFQEELYKIRREALKESRRKRMIKIAQIKKVSDMNAGPVHFLDDLSLLKRYSYGQRSSSCTMKRSKNDKKDAIFKSEDELPVTNYEFNLKDEFIVKPSNGSLGKGIKIIQTGEIVDKDSYCDSFYRKSANKKGPAVAQKYIKSHLIKGTKFDLRIYVLISSIEPFEIFVYRDGLARFCSLKATCSSKFARITNVTMNKHSSFFKKPEQISRLISDVFHENFNDQQQKKIWNEIDNLIVLSLFSGHRYLRKGQLKFFSDFQNDHLYSKSFQIFGFDVLLRENDLKPFLIEINYRPSLEFLRDCDKKMKVEMIRDALRIAAPLSPFQEFINVRNSSSLNVNLWKDEILSNKELFERSNFLKEEAINDSKFDRIWPLKSHEIEGSAQKYHIYEEILHRLDELPTNDGIVRI